MNGVQIIPVTNAADKKRFVDFAWQVYADDPHWTPPLKSEVHALLTPGDNPWFEHGRAQLFLAMRDGKIVGRISAQVDDLVQDHMERGLGQWGFFDALDGEAAAALIGAAEDWLRAQGMTKAMGPISLSIWDEPGLLIEGHDHKPAAMMGYHRPEYAAWIEAAGYGKAKDLYCYLVPTDIVYPPALQKLVEIGQKSPRIRLRSVDKSKFDEEAAIILDILNDAWSDNWGFIPLTDSEIAYAGKKLKPIIFEDLVKIAEYDGEPVAFILTIPDINELTDDLDGRLLPFGWAKFLWRLREPKVSRVRVPLMGVRKKYQGGRLSAQLAFMLIHSIQGPCRNHYGASDGEIGWVLEDNQGMLAIAQIPGTRRNRVYRVYDKPL